jgi:hypothetical protein
MLQQSLESIQIDRQIKASILAEKEDLVNKLLDPNLHVFATMITDDSYLPGVQLLAFSI